MILMRTKSALQKLCKEAYEEYGGFTTEAVRFVEAAIRESDQLLYEAIREAAWDGLRAEQRKRRSIISRGASSAPDPVQGSRYAPGVREEVVNRCAGLMTWPLMSGTPLGQATYEEVKKDAERFRTNGERNLQNARFLKLVLSKMKPGQIVGNKLKENQLQALWKEAERAS